MFRQIFYEGKLRIALLVSVALLIIGLMTGRPIWNNGWSIDLTDLFFLPLIFWFFWFIARTKK